MNNNKKKIIDLTCQHDLPVEYSRLYDKVSIQINYKYIEIIDSISSSNLSNVYWWVSSLASRDKNLSKLYHYLCCIELIIQNKESIIKNDYTIIVDNYELKLIISDILGKDVIIELNSTLKYMIIYKKLSNIIYTIVYTLIYHIIVNVLYTSNKIYNNNELTLIDNFMLPGHENYDRYYGSMLDHLSDRQKQDIYYVYTLSGYSIIKMICGLRKLRKNNYRHTYKERYLKIYDYVFAYLYIFKINNFIINDVYFNNINIKKLILSDIYNNNNIYSSVIALLNYRLFYRLKRLNYKITTTVNWFENQPLDKGWNHGVNTYYPQANNHAYVGYLFYFSNYLSPYPTVVEQNASVLPKIYFLPGDRYIKMFKTFNNSLNVMLAPAFRYFYINNIIVNNKNYSNILLCLDGVSISDDIKCIIMVYELKKELKNANIIVKPHPLISVDVLRKHLDKKYFVDLKFVESEFKDTIIYSNILVSNGATSVCVEALLLGIPVIIFAKNNGITYFSIDNYNNMLTVCYSISEIIECINRYYILPKLDPLKYLESYVQPFDNELFMHLLGHE